MFNKIVKWLMLIFGVLGCIAAAALYQHNMQTVGITETKPVSAIGSAVTQTRSAGSGSVRPVQIHPGNGNTDGVERF